MSERIYQAITDDFIRRMRNWAEWEGGGGASAISSIYEGMPSDGWGSDAPIILEGEALDTALALDSVAIRYRQAVMQFWRFEGRPLRWHARHLRLGLEHRTFESWVIKGHDELVAFLRARSAAYHDKHRQKEMTAYSS